MAYIKATLVVVEVMAAVSSKVVAKVVVAGNKCEKGRVKYNSSLRGRLVGAL